MRIYIFNFIKNNYNNININFIFYKINNLMSDSPPQNIDSTKTESNTKVEENDIITEQNDIEVNKENMNIISKKSPNI